MFKPIMSQEEKKLVGHLTKKKKLSGRSVYFNKAKHGGNTTYFTGKFFSAKNSTHFTYRSSYELRFYEVLEQDSNVVNYIAEGFSLPYVDSMNTKREYIPDLLVLHTDGSIIVYEVKPSEMLLNIDVQKKAEACKKYIKVNFGSSAKYKFMTEKELFPTPKDYTDFIKKLKKDNDPSDFS
jgi:hypothetical protein